MAGRTSDAVAMTLSNLPQVLGRVLSMRELIPKDGTHWRKLERLRRLGYLGNVFKQSLLSATCPDRFP